MLPSSCSLPPPRSVENDDIRAQCRHKGWRPVLEKEYLTKSPTSLANATAALAGFGGPSEWREGHRLGRAVALVRSGL